MAENHLNILGLTDEQVILARRQYGQNQLDYKKENTVVLFFN